VSAEADPATLPAAVGEAPPLPDGLRLTVVSGPDRGRTLALAAGKHLVGKAEDCDLVLVDPRVSRRHLELTVSSRDIRVRDLGSSNGTFFGGVRVQELTAGVGTGLVIGDCELLVTSERPLAQIPPSPAERFGALLGASDNIRRVFTLLERVAPSDAAVLLCGETGTGKELVAEGLHERSSRRERPFVVCDLAGTPKALIESELFGHVRGAFTGADRDREGAFTRADGGTIFLDEIGELDREVQPRLLRVLERRQVKPVGGSSYRAVDVRVIAATNRDLAAEVRNGQFRSDLFHRLEVVRIELPSLRERRGDIPRLVAHFLQGASLAGRPGPRFSTQTMAALVAHDWPGNVRQLRNVIERAVALCPEDGVVDAALLGLGAQAAPPDAADPGALPFKQAKDRLVQAWEREYLGRLLSDAQQNVSEAARRAGLSRMHLYELLRKHGLARPSGE